MSVAGFQENIKHGGAHETTHEISELSTEGHTSQYGEELQNGGCQSFDVDQGNENGEKRGADTGCSCLPEHLQFLSDELDSYDQSIAENNAEWLKSRCKTEDSVCFDSSPNVATNALSNSETVNNDATTGDCLRPGIVSIDPVSELSLCTDGTVGYSNVQSILISQHDPVNVNMQIPSTVDIQTATQSALDTCSPSSELPLLTTPNDTDIGYEAGIKTELPSFVLQNIVYAKENQVGMIASPDLESMPSLAFENTVGTNATSAGGNVQICANDGVISIVPTTSDCKFVDNTTLNKFQTDQSNSYITATSAINTGVLHTDSQVPTGVSTLMNISPAEHSESQNAHVVTSIATSSNEQLLQQGNLNLSTISISNDKASNSTKILVDTSEGQQLYELNLSDLARHAQCITTQAGVVHPQLTAANPGCVSGTTDQPPTCSDIPEQKDGVIPGLVLMPVSEQNCTLTTRMLLTMPATQIETLTNPKLKGKGKKMFLCTEPDCGKMFLKVSDLNVHHMTHSGLRPFKCSAERCDWAFTTIYKLRRHEESHQGNKKFVCDVCQKKYTTVYNLRSHMKLHERPCNETCPQEDCGLKFSTKRKLSFHIRSAHEGTEKMYKCPVEGCDKLFYSEHCMGSHPRVHQQDPDELVCKYDGCGRRFEKLCRLKQHQRVHTGEKPFVCHFEGCDWAFTTASKLTRHVVKHTGKRKWVCKTCGRAFMRAEHLKGHMITHSGLRPFHCPIQGCDCKFAAKSSLYVHMKKHNHALDDITYHCPMESCDKKYLTKANLRSHIMKHFPGCLTPEDAAQLNIVPLTEKAGIMADKGNQKQTGTSVALPPNHMVTVKTAADGTITVNPADFISPTGTPADIKTEGHYTAELTAPLSTKMGSYVADRQVSPPVQPRIMVKKGEHSDNNSGSARTDYRSNQLLSDRARKRRKLLKEKADGAELVLADVSVNASVMVAQTGELSETEGVRPQGITFRDPETGVLYVQMQLLQDDPPHPEMYAEDGILNGELTLPDPSDSDMVDHTQAPSEFVGSTINLQDLVG